MAKIVVLQVEVDGVSQSINTIDDLKQAIINTKKELSGKAFGSEAFTKLNNQLGALESTLVDVRNISKAAGQNFVISADQGKNSYRSMTTELNKLRAVFRQLSETERNSNIGKGLITQIQKLDRELKKIDGDLGQFQRNVGNYKQGIAGFADILSGGLISGGSFAVATLALQKISEITRRGVNDIKDYGAALADLSAILGLTGADLQKFEQAALDLQVIEVEGQKIVSTGKEIFNAFKLIGSAQPELLKSEASLQAVAKAAIVLNQSMGGPLETTVKAITTILGQFGLEAAQADEIINILAASSKEGNAEVGDLATSFQRVGIVAKLNNISLTETAAILEILAKGEQKGETAAIALRQALLRLSSAQTLPPAAQRAFEKYGVNVDILSDKLIPFGERLKELQKIQGDVTAANAIFGESAVVVGALLANSGRQFDILIPKLNNTTQAYDQAAIKADTLDRAQKNLTATITNFFTVSGTGAEAQLRDAYNAITDALIELKDTAGLLSPIFEGLNDTLNDLTFTLTGARSETSLFAKGIDLVKNFVAGLGAILGGVAITIEQSARALTTFTSAVRDAFSSEEALERRREEAAQKRESNQIARSGRGQSRVKLQTEEEKELQAALDEALAKEKARDGDSKKLGDSKVKTIEAQIGSIQNLQNKIRDLNTDIQNSNDIEFKKRASLDIKKFTEQLKRAEAQLKTINNLINDPDFVTFNDPITDELNTQAPISAQEELQSELTKIEKEAIEERLKIYNEDLINRINAAIKTGQELAAQDKQDIEDQKERRKLAADTAISTAQIISDAVFQIESNNLEKRTSAQLEALDKESALKIKLAGGDQEKINQIEFQAAKKKEAIELAAAKKRKEIALKEAVIRGALASITALTVPPPGNVAALLLALATTAAEIAVISSTQFAKGGKVKTNENVKLGDFQKGYSHAGGGNMHSFGETEAWEFMDTDEHGDLNIINKKSSSKFRRQLQSVSGLTFPGKGQLLSDINSYSGFGKRYELGGIAPAFVRISPQQSSQSLEVNLSKNDIRSLAIETGKEVQKGSARGTETGANNAINQNKRRDQARQRSIL